MYRDSGRICQRLAAAREFRTIHADVRQRAGDAAGMERPGLRGLTVCSNADIRLKTSCMDPNCYGKSDFQVVKSCNLEELSLQSGIT